MTREVITGHEEMQIADMAAILEEKRIERLPIVRDGRLVGIVSRADFLHGLAVARLEQTTPGDEEIRRAVSARIRDDAGVRDLLLHVVVTDGVVHLWGAVSSKAEREAALVAAESVSGVRSVVEHTSVLPDSIRLGAE